MKSLLFIFIYFVLQFPCHADANATKNSEPCGQNALGSEPSSNKNSIHQICIKNVLFAVSYRDNTIYLEFNGKKRVLQKVPKGFEPTKVGSENLNSFLSPELQPYKKNNILLYTTAIPTNGGSGGGQCGAGVEIYLHALDVGGAVPKTISSVLIGSCEESIELDDQDLSTAQLGAVRVKDGRLTLKFLNYKTADGSPTAILSRDLKRLELR